MHNGDLLNISVQDNGQIILYEEEGGFLRGNVILECRNTTRIKSITLKFQGRARCHWNQDGNNYKEEHKVIEHSWSFLPPSKTSRIFHGRHQWEFCLQLPTHLPSSLDRQEDRHCDITYRLKAIAERPTFSPNFVVRRPVRVSHCIRNSHLLHQPAVFGDQHPLLNYQVQLSGTVARPGSTIPIDFYLYNIDPTKVTKIRSVACYLRAYITLTCRNQFVRKSSHTISYFRDDHFIPLPNNIASFSRSASWSKTEQLRIPGQIPSDVSSNMIKIKHRLKISISVAKNDGRIEEITSMIPITVCQVDQSGSFQNNSDYNNYGDITELLPTYETGCRSTDVTLAFTPMSGDGCSSSSPIWHTNTMTELTRCPSYKSIASNHTRLSRTNLPGYDSIVSLSVPTSL
ncbi:hypothetical protein INT45_000954 [Circinella minor]|uniref:Arrestin C-terminal-like domain-containing protein n=1 Tax=Circinella minor TaxID=1195481 RepID=A0A8H7VJA3_9FUNG|nr:hypothetical protein INT45_000954 [Circinella minor]